MSRRDIVINTLLGLLLISALGLPLLLGFAVLKGVSLVIATFWPQLAHSQDGVFLVFLAFGVLASAIAHSRKQHWRSAFLCFAALPMILSVWFAGPHAPLGFYGSYETVIVLAVLFMPLDSAPTRFQFFAATSVISA
ncbi:MAG: hypothetical protein WBQ08_15125, partial [Candidatus Sulfotelmatobacter sp.]